ncbi:MAG: hypothetical protein WC455_21815 [Dehalococcoidia bacterium]|jgi:hypothetical protein
MTTLAEVMLDVCRLVTSVQEGTATGGSTTTLLDTNLTRKQGMFNDGTLWMLSGTHKGKCLEIKMYGVGSVTLKDTLTGAITAGDMYSIASGDHFPKWQLKQAVAHVLKITDVPAINITHTAASGVCTLTDISDIRQVYVDDKRNFHWEERAGKIYFDDTEASGDLKLHYMKSAWDNTMTDTSAIDNAVDPRYLMWAAAEYLWRSYIERHRGDNAEITTELKKEAQANAAEAAQMKRKYSFASLPRDPHYSRWTK